MDTKFRVNEIVWAKLQGKPWSPALITEQKPNEAKCTVLFIGDSAQVDMPQEALKSFSENLPNYKRTKNTKVLRAILAALKLLNGEASIDDEWAKAEALQQIEDDKRLLADYIKNHKKNGNTRSEVRPRNGKNISEDDDNYSDKVVKKVKKACDSKEFPLNEKDFSQKSAQKVVLSAEFFEQLCSLKGVEVETLNDSKLVLNANHKPSWTSSTSAEDKVSRELTDALVQENESKMQLYLTDFVMKLQNPKVLYIDEKDADLTKIEKLILAFDVEVIDSVSLMKSSFVKMVQMLEIAMERHRKKLTSLQKEFTIPKIGSFLGKVKQKIIYETMDCTQFLNAFKIFDTLEANHIFQRLLNPDKDPFFKVEQNGKSETSSKARPTVISLLSDEEE